MIQPGALRPTSCTGEMERPLSLSPPFNERRRKNSLFRSELSLEGRRGGASKKMAPSTSTNPKGASWRRVEVLLALLIATKRRFRVSRLRYCLRKTKRISPGAAYPRTSPIHRFPVSPATPAGARLRKTPQRNSHYLYILEYFNDR